MIPGHLDDVIRSLRAIEATDGGRAALDSPRRCDYDWGEEYDDPAPVDGPGGAPTGPGGAPPG